MTTPFYMEQTWDNIETTGYLLYGRIYGPIVITILAIGVRGFITIASIE